MLSALPAAVTLSLFLFASCSPCSSSGLYRKLKYDLHFMCKMRVGTWYIVDRQEAQTCSMFVDSTDLNWS